MFLGELHRLPSPSVTLVAVGYLSGVPSITLTLLGSREEDEKYANIGPHRDYRLRRYSYIDVIRIGIGKRTNLDSVVRYYTKVVDPDSSETKSPERKGPRIRHDLRKSNMCKTNG